MYIMGTAMMPFSLMLTNHGNDFLISGFAVSLCVCMYVQYIPLSIVVCQCQTDFPFPPFLLSFSICGSV